MRYAFGLEFDSARSIGSKVANTLFPPSSRGPRGNVSVPPAREREIKRQRQRHAIARIIRHHSSLLAEFGNLPGRRDESRVATTVPAFSKRLTSNMPRTPFIPREGSSSPSFPPSPFQRRNAPRNNRNNRTNSR